VDHIDHFAGVNVHQHDIVVIANPAVRAVNIRQTILPRIVDVIPRREEQAVEIKADIQAAVAVVPIGRIVAAQAEDTAVAVTVPVPVIPGVVAPPLTVPPAMIAA